MTADRDRALAILRDLAGSPMQDRDRRHFAVLKSLTAPDGPLVWREDYRKLLVDSMQLGEDHTTLTAELAAAEEALAAAEAERDKALAALRELVELKIGPRDENYYSRKAGAWERAYALVRPAPDSTP